MSKRGKVAASSVIVGWTGEEDELLKKLHRQGLSFEQISRRMPGRTKNACIAAARRLELPERGQFGGRQHVTYTDHERAIAKELFQSGKPYQEIGEALGKTRDAIIKLVKREKWVRTAPVPGGGRKRLAPRPSPQAARRAAVKPSEAEMEINRPTVEGVTLLNAERRHCRHVCGPHKEEGAVLCGGPANYPKQPYCDRHGLKTYQDTPPAPLRFGASFGR